MRMSEGFGACFEARKGSHLSMRDIWYPLTLRDIPIPSP